MKKLGFTLSEVIIALGIVGVIAAMTAPLISGILPDKGKVIVLNTYKTLNDINQEMLSNPGLYMKDGTCTGLRCDQQPTRPPYNTATYSGAAKYPRLLAKHLDSTSTSLNNNGRGSIVLSNGTVLNFTTAIDLSAVRVYVLRIETNLNNKNCTYNKTTCKNPNRFILQIINNGTVRGGDPLTEAYLANPYKLNDRKNDLRAANKSTTNLDWQLSVENLH